jgi:UDP-2,3-diacylglucosamine pyrophosphatase LpxH
MLTIFSDIHVTDESTAINVAPEAFNILFDEIKDNAINKKAQEVRVILLGDIFDLVRTDYWLKLPRLERPWNGDLDHNTGMNSNPKVEKYYCEILTKILSTPSGKSLIKMLNSIKSDDIKVPVIINYVIGNHDRAFYNFPSLKKILKDQFTNVDSFEFLNSYYNSDYASLCRHWNEYDISNYGFELYNVLLDEAGKNKNTDLFNQEVYKVITIGEVVTCELMSGIIFRIKERLHDYNFTKLLMDLNNVRPMLNVFSWLYWYSKDLKPEIKTAIMDSFKESLEAVIDSDLAKKWTKISPEILFWKMDLIDIFELIHSVIKNENFDDVAKFIKIAQIINNTVEKLHLNKDYGIDGAKLEWNDKKYQEVQYVFFGHTHEARTDYFKGFIDSKVNMYINTGTYLPYIDQTEDKEGFAEAYQMTMAFVYNLNEDLSEGVIKVNPSMDIWNGLKRKVY